MNCYWKPRSVHIAIAVLAPFLFSPHALAEEFEASGYVGAQIRTFTESPETQLSVAVAPQWYWQADNGQRAFSATLFARADEQDADRTHADIRELKWLYVAEQSELHIGIGKVFWGVSESTHLVDIINQTDAVESPDGEEKLGQPMMQWSHFSDLGIIDAFVLPYFRERTFPGTDGRLGAPYPIDIENARYESDAKQWHTDLALRYSNTLGNWDLGLSYFRGTNRDPHFIIASSSESQPRLIPFYDQIDQVGLAAQATVKAWLWKLEAIYRKDSQTPFRATNVGFEYTIFNIKQSAAELGLLIEHQYDSRDDDAPTAAQNDVFVGVRLTLNDIQDSNFLAGFIQDLDDSQSHLAFIEANRRLGNRWRATIDGRLFSSSKITDPVFSLKHDDHITFTMEFYY